MDKPRIRQPAHLGRGLDSDNPQGSEFSLTIPAIAVRKATVADDGFFDRPQQVPSAAVTTFRFAKQTLVSTVPRDAVTDSHGSSRST